MRDALVDLEEATQIASSIGDRLLEVECLLESATVLDHLEGVDGEIARSTALVKRARELLALVPDPGLALDCDLADGRTLFREQKMRECAELLTGVLARAHELVRHETATIAALLLGCALSDQKHIDEADRVFTQMIDDCTTRDDRFHLAAVYGNRAWLWSARGDLDRTEADLRLVIQLARESGQAHFERIGTHNLAEHRLWRGDLEEALQLARRGLTVQTQASEGSTRPDRLLLARVLAAKGLRPELRALLETFDADGEPGDEERVVLAILGAVANGDAGGWGQGIPQLASLFTQLRLEMGVLAARAGQLPADARADLVELARADPLWAPRANEF
jgi:tetratricopeptide (TPR) repeat protein